MEKSTKKKLLQNQKITIESQKSYTPPRGSADKKLLALWQEVLGTETEIGIDTDFFRVGGHSLNAIRLVAMMHKTLAIKITLAELFKTPTIRELALKINDTNENDYQGLEPTEKKEYYPLTSTQKKPFIGLEKVGEDTILHNMTHVYVIDGNLDIKKFNRVFATMVRRHETLRTSYQIVDARGVQRINDNIEFNVKYGECPEKNIQKKIKNFIRPFDLSKAPLLRVELLKVAKEKYYVLFDMHHIISDGVSMQILVKEFYAMYTEVPLEPLPIQFKDYAVWQDKQEGDPAFKKHEKYWLNKMEDFVFTQIPYDTPPVDNIMVCDDETLTFENDKFKTLEQFCNRTKTTRFTLIMAIFKLILAGEIGQADLTVAVRIITRQQHELKNLIAVLLNKILIRTNVEKNDTFSTHLRKVNQTVLEALDHSVYPYEQLVAKLKEQRKSKGVKSGMESILVNYQPPAERTEKTEKTETTETTRTTETAPTTPQDNPLNISQLEIGQKYSRYDMELVVADSTEKLNLHIFYKQGIYKRERIKKLMNAFETVIAHALENDEEPVSRLV
ncbi:MAG: hypothetical protein GY757_27040 [bacterium]|nr:hypothetical protein [bacterium]